jgi:hypothetical protein
MNWILAYLRSYTSLKFKGIYCFIGVLDKKKNRLRNEFLGQTTKNLDFSATTMIKI